MLRVSDALRSLIDENPLLRMGIEHRLLNLSQVAKFLCPQIAARTKKEVSESSVLMSLSRLQQAREKVHRFAGLEIHIDNIAVHSNLLIVCYVKTREVHRLVNSVYSRIQRRGGYITITEGTREITLILEKRHEGQLEELAAESPICRYEDVASLGVVFGKEYLTQPGLYYLLFQQLYFQNINVLEIASSATELIFYLEDQQVQLAFDTLYRRFVRHETRR